MIVVRHFEFVWDDELSELQRKLAAIMAESCRRSCPGVEVVQLTDDKTPHLECFDRVIRRPWGTDAHIPYTCAHWADLPPNFISLDSDVVVLRDIRKILDLPNDLIVTARDNKAVAYKGQLMPINMGVFACKTPEIWLEVKKRVEAMDDLAERQWWGSQIALWAMYQENKWDIECLDMNTFNYTPKTEDEEPKDQWVFHYKGRERKKWMLNRWASLIG